MNNQPLILIQKYLLHEGMEIGWKKCIFAA